MVSCGRLSWLHVNIIVLYRARPVVEAPSARFISPKNWLISWKRVSNNYIDICSTAAAAAAVQACTQADAPTATDMFYSRAPVQSEALSPSTAAEAWMRDLVFLWLRSAATSGTSRSTPRHWPADRATTYFPTTSSNVKNEATLPLMPLRPYCGWLKAVDDHAWPPRPSLRSSLPQTRPRQRPWEPPRYGFIPILQQH